jgi:hypothetical protein
VAVHRGAERRRIPLRFPGIQLGAVFDQEYGDTQGMMARGYVERALPGATLDVE